MQSPLPNSADVDILAKLAIQLPIATGLAIVISIVYFVVKLDDTRRRQERKELLDFFKQQREELLEFVKRIREL